MTDLPPVPVLNTTQSVEVLDQDGYDPATVVDLGEALSIAQVAEDGTLHNIVIGLDQLEALVSLARKVLG